MSDKRCYICDFETEDSNLTEIESIGCSDHNSIQICNVCLSDINQEFKILKYEVIQ